MCVAVLVVAATLAGQRPGVGTAGVIFGVAPVVNATVSIAGGVPSGVGQALYWILGMVAIASGASLLVAARLGAPGLEMVTLAMANRRIGRFNVGIVAARSVLEATLVALAIVLGGAVGIGTLLFAVCAGPMLRLGISAASRLVYGPLEAPVPAPAD